MGGAFRTERLGGGLAKIKQIADQVFNFNSGPEKLRLDLFGYLNDMNYTINSNREYCVSVPNIDTSIYAERILSPKDDIHVIKYIANYNVIGGFHYYITVGIGNYIEYTGLGLFTVDKCLDELKYNDDLTFYDAESYIEELSRQR